MASSVKIPVHSPFNKRICTARSGEERGASIASILLHNPMETKSSNSSSETSCVRNGIYAATTGSAIPFHRLSWPSPGCDFVYHRLLPLLPTHNPNKTLITNFLTSCLSRIPTGHMRWDPKTQHMWCGPGLPPPTMDEMNNEGR